MIPLARLSAVVLVGAGFAGCTTPPPRHDPSFSPSYAPAYTAANQSRNGAIYQAGTGVFLYNDLKARRVGDILTVHLTESTAASKSSGTNAKRTNSTSVTNPTLMGAAAAFSLPQDAVSILAQNGTMENSLRSATEFAGKGDSAMKNSFTGDISVTVAEVLPNGNMVVRGEKRINLNEGNEYVQISGIVRREDILPNNTVLSTRLGDATIVYKQDGQIADASKAGWLARFFTSPLFPF